MKITLISPYSDITSFGIRGLSSLLRKDGYRPRLIFLPHDKNINNPFQRRYSDKILNDLADLCRDSDIIGISLMTEYFPNAVEITQKLKKELDTLIIWGGVHPTTSPEECLKFADAVCIGEGEFALLELVQKMDRSENFYDVENLWFKKDGKIITNGNRPLIQDLDSLPLADYDLENNFILDGDAIVKMDLKLFEKYVTRVAKHGEKEGLPTYQLIGSRGCPHNCTYCCNNAFRKMYPKQRWLRHRSIKNIIKELIDVKQRFSFIKAVLISDDSFFARGETEFQKFAELYKKHINLPFRCLGSPLTIRREKVRILVNAGLFSIQIGIQSGSKNTLRMYNRRISNEKVLETAKIIKEFKSVYPIYDIIIDNPFETDNDRLETLRLISQIPRPFHLNIFSLSFFPGTELYENARNNGIVKDSYYHIYSDHNPTYINLLFSLYKRKQPGFILHIMSNRTLVVLFGKPFFKQIWALIFFIKNNINLVKKITYRQKHKVRPL